MKKALVLALTLVLGLGLFASAQTWEGTWDTDITIDPSTTVFADFLSFDSDLDIDFLVGGWTFGMTSDFSGIGLDGLGFTAEGVLGAFSFDIDMDFAPMKATAVETAFTGLDLLAAADSPCLQTNSWTYTTKTVTTTYTPAFDDLTVEGSVSIAGLSFGALFFLEGTDSDLATSYSNYVSTGFPTQVDKSGVDETGMSLQTTLLSVASSVKVGTGAKFTISGSFAGATFTNYTYFNLVEYSDHDVSAYDVDYLATVLQMSGVISGLECAGCNVMFTRNYTLIEGLAPFGDCLTVDIAIDFSCCDFEGFAILIKDVSLGCCWDLGFDFLVEFDTTSKTMKLEPEMTFASSCFTIVADVVWADNTVSGIKFQGLSYSHVFNGVTVSFAATWDYSANPLVGSYGYITHTYADMLHFWKPDVKGSNNAVATPANDPAINLTDGIGDWVMVDIACSYDRAYVINQMSISYEADACCAGALSFDVDTYFGNITRYVLDGVYGTYYWDTDNDGTYEAGEFVEFLGPNWGYADYVALTDVTATEPLATNSSPSSDVCDPCETADTIAESSLLVGHYTGTAITSILGWVETDAEVTLGLGSNVAFTLGLDVSWFGWGSLTFGVEFTF